MTCMAHRVGKAHDVWYRYDRVHGRRVQMPRLGTTVQAFLVQGYRKNHQHRLHIVSYLLRRSGTVPTSSEAHARNTIRKNHFDTDSHVVPCPEIVPSPHGTKTLRTSIEGTSEDKRALVWVRAFMNGLPSVIGLGMRNQYPTGAKLGQ